MLPAVLLFCAAASASWASRPSTGCRLRADPHEARGVEETLIVAGQKRAFLLDVPAAALRGTPVPLLLDFHGFQHSAAGVWRVSEFKELGAARGFITVYPQGLPVRLRGREGVGWDLAPPEHNGDVQFTIALIEHVAGRYCIDLDRVFATGFSNGAFLSHLLACALAGRIAGIAPVGGGTLEVPCAPAQPIPVIIHHGIRDDRVPVARARALRDQWRALNGCEAREVPLQDGCVAYRKCKPGGAVVYCESDLEHHWPPGAGKRIWEFFESAAGPVPTFQEPLGGSAASTND